MWRYARREVMCAAQGRSREASTSRDTSSSTEAITADDHTRWVAARRRADVSRSDLITRSDLALVCQRRTLQETFSLCRVRSRAGGHLHAASDHNCCRRSCRNFDSAGVKCWQTCCTVRVLRPGSTMSLSSMCARPQPTSCLGSSYARPVTPPLSTPTVVGSSPGLINRSVSI